MQRFLNDPDDLVDETVAGFVKAHKDNVHLHAEHKRVVVSNALPIKGKVGIVTGGGSGHEPAFLGYTGKNMLDAVAIGELFSSPTAASFVEAIKIAESGAGVAVLYGNYAGDNMNVKMAERIVNKSGIEIAKVVANDDVCSAPKDDRAKRRGVAGEIFMWKIGAAKAAQMATLAEVQASAQAAIDATRSVAIGVSPCTLPAVGHPNFQIDPGKMEIGIGHHGEPGTQVSELKSANECAKIMVDTVLDDLDAPGGTEFAVLVSGLGMTPINELYTLYDRMESLITARGYVVYKAYVGNYFTSLEMGGATLTVMALDAERKALLDLDINCPALK